MSSGTLPVVFLPCDNTSQHLKHYWDTILPGRCIEIIWYFCTYDHADLISLYVKVCVRYGIFIHIRLKYVPVVFPNMSWGTWALCGTTKGKKMSLQTLVLETLFARLSIGVVEGNMRDFTVKTY